MATLLLRLAGPMQAWGTDSKVDTRATGAQPSKSGVIGMIASAMGRSRDESVEDLSVLRFGVRTDQAGTMLRDYHTAHHPTDTKRAYITNRFYLEDAVFLIGLEGDEPLLRRIDEAVMHPYYPLFMGRRSCPVSGRVSLGMRDKPLREALTDEPWLASDWYKRRHEGDAELELTLDAEGSEGGYLVRDVPVSFSQNRRRYGFRKVESGAVPRMGAGSSERTTAHDPFEGLEGLRCIYRAWSSTSTAGIQ